MIGKLIGVIICLVFSAFFSATETAFTSVNIIRIKNMANDGDKKAERVLRLNEKYDALLSTILIGNNIVNIALTAIATVIFIELYPMYGPTISTVVTTIIVLIFGEVSPKSIAKDHAEGFSMFSAPIIEFFMMILLPLTAFFSAWKKVLSKVFKVKDKALITEDELITMVNEAETEGGIDEAQSELIQNAIEFNELIARDVLTPRVDVKAIDITDSKEEIDKLFKETGFSRIPVYEDDLDNVLGVLNQKDWSNYIKDTKVKIDKYIKPLVFVSGSIKLSQLLKKLQKEKCHIAVIVDEYGGTEGIVTMEDILEELVGEIYDEHDRFEGLDITENKDKSYTILSNSNLDKMFDFFDIKEDVDATTVNGWVMIELDKLPKKGDKFTYIRDYKKLDVSVIQADERRSIKIKVKVTELERE